MPTYQLQQELLCLSWSFIYSFLIQLNQLIIIILIFAQVQQCGGGSKATRGQCANVQS